MLVVRPEMCSARGFEPDFGGVVTQHCSQKSFPFVLQFRHMGMDWWTEQAEGLRERIDRGESFRWFAPYVDGSPDL